MKDDAIKPSAEGEDIHDMAEPAFDHHMYPQLIDAILDSAPSASLLAFRGVDRHYRGRIDDMLCEHVIAMPTEPETEKRGFEIRSFKCPDCRLPLIPYDPKDPFDKWAINGGKGDPPEVTAAGQAAMDCREDVAARIRVVDMYGKPRVPYPYRQAFQDLQVIRYAGEWDPPVNIAFAPTVVDFIDLPRQPPNFGEPTYFDPGDGVTRHIVHFGYPARGGGSRWISDLAMFSYPTVPEDKRDIVLVLSPRSREVPGDAESSSDAVKPSDDLLTILAKVAKNGVLHGGTVTYVGVDDIPARHHDSKDQAGNKANDELRIKVNEEITKARDEFKVDSSVEELARRVSYMTIDEWRASLPEEDVDIECDWPTFVYP